MSHIETEFSALIANLQSAALRDGEPAPDLWARIECAHMRQKRRRIVGAGMGLVSMASVLTFSILLWREQGPAAMRGTDIDWQGRAQALELQLQALQPAPAGGAFRGSSDVESELAQVDHMLQTAYEHDGYERELAPLWKRRSELLDALLLARQHDLALVSI